MRCDWRPDGDRFVCARCGDRRRRPFARVCRGGAAPPPPASCWYRTPTARIVPADVLGDAGEDQAVHYCALHETPTTIARLPPHRRARLRTVSQLNWRGHECEGCEDCVPVQSGPPGPGGFAPTPEPGVPHSPATRFWGPTPTADDTRRYWRWITTAQYVQDCLELARLVNRPIRGVCGVPRSGVVTAGILSCVLNVPLYGLTDAGPVLLPGSGRRLNDRAPRSGPLLLCDDDAFSGITMDKIKRRLVEQKHQVLTAAPYKWSGCFHPPDYFLRVFPCTWICEWRFFSSFFVRKTAYDFDGIFCRDCPPEDDDDGPRYRRFLATAAPLWVVQPQTIPLVVTARREKYRPQTLAWLKAHGSTVDRLVMGQWPSLRERTIEKVLTLKAETFRRDGALVFFCESDPWQAEQIAQRVPGKPVICPAAAKIWNSDKLTEPREDGKPFV